MSGFDRGLLPWLLVAIAAGTYLGADCLARARRRSSGGERGDYWSSVVLWTIVALGIPLLLSSWIETLSATTWQTGWHLQFDRTGGWGARGPWAYRWALLLPFAVWTSLLAIETLRPPRDRSAGRWLAGGVGENGSRAWILAAALLPSGVLVAAQPRLGGGPHAFPATAWGFQAVLALSLVGVARSRGRNDLAIDEESATEEVAKPAPTLVPWAEALTHRGIEAPTLIAWPADERPRPAKSGGLLHLARRVEMTGAREVEPQLVEEIEKLLDPQAPEETERLIYAPDHAGQAEVVAVAATLLADRFHERTLVITPRPAESCGLELERWLRPGLLQQAANDVVPSDTALVWVVDAETLSNRLLPEKLREPDRLRSLGLIVWWDLQDYSGVLAANLWAVSRRLDRLVRRWGRPDVRTLALMRTMPHGAAEPARFVQSLLHAFHLRTVHVGRRFARRVELHLLAPGLGTTAAPRPDRVPEAAGHLLLRSARASVDAGWPTHLEPPAGIPDGELRSLLQVGSEGRPLAECLEPGSESAGASLLSLDGGDVLSLPDRVARRGRSGPRSLPHHVGIMPPENPYARHLLRQLAQAGGRGGFSTSRRLVGAAGTPELLRRHLLLALEELPDTGEGLSRSFHRQDELIRTTLDQLADEGQLHRSEVRYLDEHERVQADRVYRSLRAGADARRPLSTVGLSLVDVVDVAAAREDRGVRMRVDPERLAIEAYPSRVFLAAGRRYRIKDWSAVDHRAGRTRVECELEGRQCRTWRLRKPSLDELDPGTDDFVVLSGGSSPVARLVVDATYVERVRGALRLEHDRFGLLSGEPQRIELRLPIITSFPTRALVMRIREPGEPSALFSLAQALRHVLPVHVGVAEDALEVVALTDERIRRQPISGLAVVDLYPGGIGLIDALGDDEALLLDLLGRARDWLEACPCQKDAGCVDCLQSPATSAASPDLPVRRATALELLREILG